MTTGYKPKHKRPDSWGGSTPRGPERWLRAAHNAFTNPNTKAAELFMDRVTRAHQLRRNFGMPANMVVAFMDVDWSYRSSPPTVTSRRRYVTCSLFCAGMQAQLDFGLKDYNELVDHFEQNAQMQLIHKSTLPRVVRCQCCGSTIKPK